MNSVLLSKGLFTNSNIATYNTFLDRLQEAGYNEVDAARSYIGGTQEALTREAD